MNQRLGRQGVSISLIVVWQTTNEFPKVCPEITIDFRSTCILLCHSQIPFSQIKLISIINSKTNMNIWKYEGEWQWEEAWICYHLLCYAFQVLQLARYMHVQQRLGNKNQYSKGFPWSCCRHDSWDYSHTPATDANRDRNGMPRTLIPNALWEYWIGKRDIRMQMKGRKWTLFPITVSYY